jgi:hypothetical protein
MLLAATVALVGCAVTASVTPVAVTRHPAFAAGTACNSPGCHDQYKHQEPYTGPCQLCHNTTNWTQVTYQHKDATFDHGMHPLVGCPKCHTEGKPLPSSACSACHTPPHKGPQDCKLCHTTYAWRLFQLLPAGHLSLAGGHAGLTCLDCHTAKFEPATPRTCVNCHGTHHGGLTPCQDCHSPATGWNPKPGWNHSNFFVLRGAHKFLQCAQCHVNNRFAGTPRVCVGCHGAHHGGLTQCQDCHTTSAFIPTTFNHSSVFVLGSAHSGLKCSTCHPGGVYTKATHKANSLVFAFTITHAHPTCGQCHSPQHGGLTDCADCHVSTFHHSSFFALTGAHASLACSKCHVGGVFTHAKSSGGGVLNAFDFTHAAIPNPTCNDCHSLQHGASLTAECNSCHTTTTFATAPLFNHPAPPFVPSLPLQHQWTDFGPYPAGCIGCHPGGLNFTTYSCTTCHAAP